MQIPGLSSPPLHCLFQVVLCASCLGIDVEHYLQVVAHHNHEVHYEDAHEHQEDVAQRIDQHVQPVDVWHVDVVRPQSNDVAKADVVLLDVGLQLWRNGSTASEGLWAVAATQHACNVHGQQGGVALAEEHWMGIVWEEPAPHFGVGCCEGG